MRQICFRGGLRRSFCMTCYNSGQRINKVLESIIPFLTKKDELIIVDNYSKDNTKDIVNDFIKRYNDKKILFMEKHCNRGKGWQICFEHSNGNHIILVASDCIYFPIFWNMLNKWSKNDLYNEKVLYANETWIYPHKTLIDINGFPPVNSREDAVHWQILFDNKSILWFPFQVGENWKPVDDPEKRFTNSFFERLWRMFLNYKDAFRVDRSINFSITFDSAKKFASNKITLFLFWLPLISITSLYRIGKGKPVPRFVTDDMVVTLGLCGNRHKNIFDWDVE